MANYSTKKRFSAAELIAVILGILLAASIVLGVGSHLGWFDKTDDADNTDVEQTEEDTTTDDGTTTEDGTATESSEDIVYEFVSE